MKCPFCKTRISKNTDLCPNCGQRIEKTTIEIKSIGTISVDILKKFGYGFLVFVLCILVFISEPSFWRTMNNPSSGRVDLQADSSCSFEDALKTQKGIVDEEVLNVMQEYGKDIKDILENQEYQNIELKDVVYFDGFLHSSTVMSVSASTKQHDVKITFNHSRYNTLTKSYAVAGTSYNRSREFELKEEDVKEIFDYLRFEDGYNTLFDAYNNMKKTEDNKYQYMKYDLYNLILSNDVYNSFYKYSYIISR